MMDNALKLLVQVNPPFLQLLWSSVLSQQQEVQVMHTTGSEDNRKHNHCRQQEVQTTGSADNRERSQYRQQEVQPTGGTARADNRKRRQ